MLSGVNYFFRSTTTILPDRRQLQALRMPDARLDWCWPEQRVRLCRDATWALTSGARPGRGRAKPAPRRCSSCLGWQRRG